MMQKSIYSRRFDMSVGRIEMVDGIKKFVPYADSGGVIIQHQNMYT